MNRKNKSVITAVISLVNESGDILILIVEIFTPTNY
jgi:hypothetical protein